MSAKETLIASLEQAEGKKTVEDDSTGILNLRNLYRQNKIDKGQYVGGLATLLAAGSITKSDFTRLKAAVH